MGTLLHNLQRFIPKTYLILFIATGVFFPITHSIKNIFLTLILIIGALEFANYKIIKHLLSKSYTIPSLVFLLLLIFLGIFYSYANTERAFSVFSKYRKLLFPLILTPIFINHPKTWSYFMAGITIGLCLTILLALIPETHPLYPESLFHINRIYYTFTAALVAGFLFLTIIHKKQYAWYYWVPLLVIVWHLMFIAFQRTGIIIFVVLAILTLVLNIYKVRYKSVILALIPLILIALFVIPSTRAKIDRSIDELKTYSKPDSQKESLAQRLQYLHDSLIFFNNRPIQGYGTGSLSQLFADHKISYLRKTATIDIKRLIANPHNQFAFFAVELGVIGLLFFAYTFATPLIDAFTYRSSAFTKQWLVLLLAAFFVGCVSDSALFINIMGDIFIIMLAYGLAGIDFTTNNIVSKR